MRRTSLAGLAAGGTGAAATQGAHDRHGASYRAIQRARCGADDSGRGLGA